MSAHFPDPDPARDRAPPPRIVQVLDDATAGELGNLFRRVHVFVVLDEQGGLWGYGHEPESWVHAWHRLPLPPLPGGEGE